MKNSIVCLCFIFMMSCKTDNSKTQNLMASMVAPTSKLESTSHKVEGPITLTKPYELKFKVNTLNDDTFELEIMVELNNGAHFVSPFAQQDFKGKFYMDLGSYTHLEFEGDLIETPRSVEEFDDHPYVNGLVNWVRVNTTYRQALKIKLDEDFEVFGRVKFTIEPRCTLEQIPFGISYENGVMKLIDPKC